MLSKGFIRAAIAGVIGVAAFTGIGCQTLQRGTTIVKWDEGGLYPRMTVCQDTGNYGLYSSDNVKPKIVVMATKGDALGFEKMGDHIVAVAGVFHQELPDGTYYWNER